MSDDARARVTACADPAQLRDLAVEVAGATDRTAVEHLLERVPAAVASGE